MACVYCGKQTYSTFYDKTLESDVDVCIECYIIKHREEARKIPEKHLTKEDALYYKKKYHELKESD